MASIPNVKVISKCLGVYIGIPYMFTHKERSIIRERERGEQGGLWENNKKENFLFGIFSSTFLLHFCFNSSLLMTHLFLSSLFPGPMLFICFFSVKSRNGRVTDKLIHT